MYIPDCVSTIVAVVSLTTPFLFQLNLSTPVAAPEPAGVTSQYLASSDSKSIRQKINLLLASTLAEVRSRGSLSSELKINANQINDLGKSLVSRKKGSYKIIARAIDDNQSADKVSISLELESLEKDLIN